MSESKKLYSKLWWWFMVIAIIVIVVAFCGGKNTKKDVQSGDVSTSVNEADQENNIKSETINESDENEDSEVNYDNFLRIEMGMTYDQVKEILGEGKEESSSDMDGIKTIMYSWKGSELSDLTVTIQNDAVVNKAQLGLMDMDAQITMDKYDQIENGMSYDQVKEILGEGQIISETELSGNKSIIYEYINKDESNANFTFVSDSMVDKVHTDLK